MPETVIRPATPADLPAITAIYAQAVLNGTATFEIDPPDLAEMTRRYEALRARDMPYFVADHDGVVAGYTYAGAFHARAAFRFTVEDTIYISPDHQRLGLGTTLLRTLITACEARGFRQIIAVIGDSNNAGSISLHRKLGFTMVGTHRSVGLKFGGWLDTVHMQLAIGDGGNSLPA